MITISPENPTSVDSIVLTVIGSGCSENSIIIDNNPTFNVTVTEIASCNFLPPPEYIYNFQLGKLAAGQYTITHNLNNNSDVEIFSEQISISVSQAPVNTQTEEVPILSLPSLLMLVLLLSVSGKYLFRRKV